MNLQGERTSGLPSVWDIPGYAALVKERELRGSEVPVIKHWDDEQRALGLMPPGYAGAKLKLLFFRVVNLEPSDLVKRPALARKRVKAARVGMPPRSRLRKSKDWVSLAGRRDGTADEALDAAWCEFLGDYYYHPVPSNIDVRCEWYR